MPDPGFTVLHRDARVVVVVKDAGVLSAPAPGDALSLAELLPGTLVVHRLDRGTSGVMVFARDREGAAYLARQFARHSVEREYVARVAGIVAQDTGTVDTRLASDAGGTQRSMAKGQRAVTHWRVLARSASTTLLALRLETGRKHQIRCHMAELGHPLLGDDRYGGPAFERLALHARLLGFVHPGSKRRVTFEAPVPPTVAHHVDGR